MLCPSKPLTQPLTCTSGLHSICLSSQSNGFFKILVVLCLYNYSRVFRFLFYYFSSFFSFPIDDVSTGNFKKILLRAISQ